MAGVFRWIVAVAAMLLAGGASDARALGISLPATVTLADLRPGATSAATGISLSITGVVLPWTLTVTPDATPTPGRLRATGGTCSGSTTALAQPLRLTTDSTLSTSIVDQPALDLSGATTQIAHGTAADVLTIGYSQAVGAAEVLREGCVYAVNLTFTVS